MRTRIAWVSTFILICFMLVTVATATAGTVYENGPVNGSVDAWTINFGFIVSDTFTVTAVDTNVNGISFWAWLFPGDTVTSVEAVITSEEFGGTFYFDQVVNLTQSNCFANQFGFNVCRETGSFVGPYFTIGTYWLNLENAVVGNGDPVYWDENAGAGCHSEGCPSMPSENGVGTILSEAFTMLGSPGTEAPEPGSLLLFATGAIGVAGVVRRKLGRG